MAATIYLTPDGWKSENGTTNRGANNVESLLIEIYNQLYNLNNTLVSGDVTFVATAAQNAYTAADVPALANQAARTPVICTIAGTLINPSLYTWDGVTLTFNAAITFDGGEAVYVRFA